MPREPGIGYWLKLVVWLAALACIGEVESRAQPAASEYEVKAALLFNFCQFVEWPKPVLSDTNAPFVIGILGKDPFGSFLDDLVKNEHAYGKSIAVRRFRNVEDSLGAQILFISRSEQPRLSSIFASLSHRPILTVGDADGESFARRGGMIALVTENDKVRIRVNLQEARGAGLTISAKLLQLSQIVKTQK